MTWGIIGALDAEIKLLLENMEVRESVKLFGSTYYRGALLGHDVILVCCSIGKVNAAVCANTVIREFGADVIVNVGIAGAIHPDLKIFDVVISSDLIFHDADNGIMEKYYPFNTNPKADQRLIDLCVKACCDISGRDFKFYVGRIASGDVFVESADLKKKISSQFKPYCVEMEGASIAQVAYMSGLPVLVLRSISDSASDGASQLYDNFFERAAEHSASIIMAMLRICDKENAQKLFA